MAKETQENRRFYVRGRASVYGARPVYDSCCHGSCLVSTILPRENLAEILHFGLISLWRSDEKNGHVVCT